MQFILIYVIHRQKTISFKRFSRIFASFFDPYKISLSHYKFNLEIPKLDIQLNTNNQNTITFIFIQND